jgi:pimeloyl-ACP methyl ester carboxylesterase
MDETRIHRAVSTDGTEIAGHVHGQGPPLVLVHGGVGSGESWRFMLPFLTEQFTCYPMSLRGRGLSAENPDQSVERLIGDVAAFVDSIGEPVRLVGHSSGGALALGAAAQAAQVCAVAAYEPALPELDDELGARFEDAFVRMRAAAAEGRFVDAAQIAFEDVALANDEELAAIAAAGGSEFVAPNVPVHIRELEPYASYRFLEDARLEQLTIPILLLHGSRTHRLYTSVVRHLADQLAGSHVQEIPGVGHMAPMVAPEAIAGELTRFFATAPART